MTRVAERVAVRRRGPAHFWRSYRMMVRYEVLDLRLYLMMALLIQTLMGAGMAVMYGFYLGELSDAARAFLVSGIPALALFPIGFVMVPSAISESKFEDTYDYLWSLPVPRLASAAASFTVFTSLGVPGTALAVWASMSIYDVRLTPTWWVVPAVLLSSVVAVAVGYAIGHGIPEPRATNLITNMIVFLVLMFTPIVVPIELFPGWFAAVHRVLPFWHMANILRDALLQGVVENVATSYAVVGVWIVASVALATRIITRRG